jgi:hypothetical protein
MGLPISDEFCDLSRLGSRAKAEGHFSHRLTYPGSFGMSLWPKHKPNRLPVGPDGLGAGKQKEDTSMRTLTYATVVLAFVGLALLGCADKSQPPVAPTIQSASGPGSLGKVVSREFTFDMVPTGLTDPGIPKSPDGKVMVRGLRGPVYFTATFSNGLPDLLTGAGDVEISFILDYNTGVGQSHGKLTLRPEAPEAAGGVWEFTWHGTGTLGASGWTLPLKEEGHGVGGALTGMQCRLENTITTPVDVSTWAGEGQGIVISH